MRDLIFSATLAISLLFTGLISGQDLMHVDDAVAIPGAQLDLIVRLDNSTGVQGFQCALSWDSSIFTFDSVDTAGLDIELLLAPYVVEFFTSTNNDEIEPGIGWAACAAIFDFSPPFGGQTLAPGFNTSITRFHFQTANDNALVGYCTTIQPANNLGQPVIHNILTIDGVSSMPDLQGGEVCFVNSSPFLRGDANDDGSLNLADAISLISYIFGGGSEPQCRSAANANSDYTVDIGDVIFLINHQFLAGPPPGAPYPNCGADPAGEAGIGCESYESCL